MAVLWHEKNENIVALARWMADNQFPASEVAYMVEKPHKFEEEFTQAKEEGYI